MPDPARDALCVCGHPYLAHAVEAGSRLFPEGRGRQIGCMHRGPRRSCPCPVFVDRARWPFVLACGTPVLRGLLAR